MEKTINHHTKTLFTSIVVIAAILLAILLGICLIARDEAGQAEQQAVVDSVVRAMDDSLYREQALQTLLREEQARTDSATQAVRAEEQAEEAARRVDFLWSVYNQAAAKPADAARRVVFERAATKNFRRYLQQRSAALPELLFFPADDLAATDIWYFQGDWYAVSTRGVSSIVLRVVRSDGGTLLIDDIRQASKPSETSEYSDDSDGSENSDYSD